MPQYVIERTIPGAGAMPADELQNVAAHSNKALREVGPDVQWVHSYVLNDKIVCVYNAASEKPIREHAKLGGFPIDTVHEVRAVINPITGEG